MNKFETFEQFLVNDSVQISIWGFVLNLVMTAGITYLLSLLYARHGNSLSNRKMFGQNFILIGVTTMIIITIVKSSLALSLGLVGALSIVRFRAAIKEPEELAYLFLTISVGLGLGADQRLITLIGFVFVTALIYLKSRMSKKEENQNLHLTVSAANSNDELLTNIINTLKSNCTQVNMKRFDENGNMLEAAFLVELGDYSQLNKAKIALKKLDPSVNVSMLDNNGIF